MKSNEKPKVRPADAVPLHLFHQGRNFDAQMYFGAHTEKRGKTMYTVFRVWAPHAVSVSVVGEFNDWQPGKLPMEQVADGIWFAKIKQLPQYTSYKYCIETKKGEL
ncbi:MAG: 1,4-alpha-glucan branching enzyme, partial [Oscillospiraceae bacterium]|nr:1,4-alpha-glucan branching enzyme [Oscillospiraceae bacterium]